MTQRNAFKTNSSFFRMLVAGAVGTQAVQKYLNSLGHNIIELERGSLATRIWRDVKRKRVRIPDLCCTQCGVRIESRAKTNANLSMSHSPSDAERAWHYGMLDSDWVAFPILSADESVWESGDLHGQHSLWRERMLTTWRLEGWINIFTVESLKRVTPRQLKPKGVSEGAEVQVKWKARFAPGRGRVVAVNDRRLVYTLDDDPNTQRYFRLASDERPFLTAGKSFAPNQILAGQVEPVTTIECPKRDDTSMMMKQMLDSHERTVRFTGCKLARLAKDSGLKDKVRQIAEDGKEDVYVRMEAKSYLCEVAGEPVDHHFRAILLHDPDEQMRLEAAVTLAEIHTPESFNLLCEVLNNATQPLFLRSACAWAIGCHGTKEAAQVLVQTFADISSDIREEALIALQDLGAVAFDPLLSGLESSSPTIAAGAAETLRRIRGAPAKEIAELAERSSSTWPTWTLAHLPKDAVAPYVANLQNKRPEVHYALSVLWNFLNSWIANDWTPRATP